MIIHSADTVTFREWNSRAQITRVSVINPGITAGEPDITSNNAVPPATTAPPPNTASISVPCCVCWYADMTPTIVTPD